VVIARRIPKTASDRFEYYPSGDGALSHSN
jgi:hypothetical protein